MRLTALLFVGLLAGCYETPHPACAFLCGTDNSCPSSYFCAGDGWCKLEGTAETFVCEPGGLDGGVDAPVADAALDAPDVDAPEIDGPVDADIDAEIDAPVDAAIDASSAMLTILTMTPLAYGNVVQTQSTTHTVMVRNGGGSPTSPIAVTVTGSTDYTVVTGVTDTCSGQMLAPSTNCSFDIRYAPANVGSDNGVAMAMATSGGSASINLTGAGTAMLTAAPSPAAFGNVPTGMMASMPVVITNNGSVTSGTITTTPPTGAFTITADTCDGMTVTEGNTCSVMVQFAPTATGAQSSMFTLTASPGGPRTVSLTGTGQ